MGAQGQAQSGLSGLLNFVGICGWRYLLLILYMFELRIDGYIYIYTCALMSVCVYIRVLLLARFSLGRRCTVSAHPKLRHATRQVAASLKFVTICASTGASHSTFLLRYCPGS